MEHPVGGDIDRIIQLAVEREVERQVETPVVLAGPPVLRRAHDLERARTEVRFHVVLGAFVLRAGIVHSRQPIQIDFGSLPPVCAVDGW